MKAISLWQPWATLMAIGAKRIETRSWQTSYRGSLLIHAAQRWTKAQREFCMHPRVRKALETAGLFAPELLPRGAIVARVSLVHIEGTDYVVPPTTLGLRERGVCRTRDEECFGDFSPGRFAWFTEPADLHRYEPAIPCRGMQGLFEVEAPHG